VLWFLLGAWAPLLEMFRPSFTRREMVGDRVFDPLVWFMPLLAVVIYLPTVPWR
jgi:hypothetical protein